MRRLVSFVVAVAFLLPTLGNAQQASPSLPEGTDVRIIVDISGSMKENDPENLRQPAVRLLARMLPGDATAGLWTFGQYVNMLVPHGDVDQAWRDRTIERSEQINSVALRTNLGKALEVASHEWLGDDLSSTHFILLTDGKVDISENERANQEERERVLGPLLDDLSERNATIHTVALSDEADTALLETMADRTGGSYSIAPSADALNRAFLKALNTAVPQEQIPIEGNRFQVDSGVSEFTALIFWGEDETVETRELTLVRADGTEATLTEVPDNMRWVREAGYDLITVTDPQDGEWRISGELGEGSRVTVVSDLRMMVSPLPPTFTAEEPVSLQIAFFEDDQKIVDPDFLSVIDVRLTLISEDGRSGTKELSPDQPPESGVYQDTIARLPASGQYQVEVIADGQTFSRKYSGVTRFVTEEGETADAVEPPSQDVTEAPPDTAPATEGPIDITELEEPGEPFDPAAEAAGPDEQEPVVEEQAPAEEEPQPGAVPAEQDDAVEAPQTTEESSKTDLPWWWFAVAAGAIVVIGLAWYLVRRRRQSEESVPAEDTDRDVPGSAERPADAAEDAAVAVAASAASKEPGAAEPEAEPAPEPVLTPEPEPEPEPEPDNIPVAEPEETTGIGPDEEDIPVPEQIDDGEEDIPQLEAEPEVEEPAPDEEAAEEDNEEEFGLEDFDLSEFDDLPDLDEESGNEDQAKDRDGKKP